MRILLSAFACAPHSGSEPGVGWHWALELARLGHDVLVLTRARDDRITFRQPLPGELWRHTLERLGFLDALIADQRLRRALQPGDLQAAHKEGAPALVRSEVRSQVSGL